MGFRLFSVKFYGFTFFFYCKISLEIVAMIGCLRWYTHTHDVSKKGFTYVQWYSLLKWLAFTLFEGAQQQLTHSFTEVTAQECVQQRINAGIEVGDQKCERCKECIEVRVAFVCIWPVEEEKQKMEASITMVCWWVGCRLFFCSEMFN